MSRLSGIPSPPIVSKTGNTSSSKFKLQSSRPPFSALKYENQLSQSTTTVKCILVGDSGVGKTSLVVSYASNDYPAEHKPSAFDTYAVEVVVDNRPVHLQICDAGGSTDVAALRHFAYPGTHVILLCFSVVRPDTFRSLRSTWLKELAGAPLVLTSDAARTAAALYPFCTYGSHHSSSLQRRKCGGATSTEQLRIRQLPHPNVPGPAFLLVGCACDLRNDIGRLLELSKSNEQPVDEKMAERLAEELGAEAYIECSALTQKNLKTVFDLAIWCGLRVSDAGGPLQKPSVSQISTAMCNGHTGTKPLERSATDAGRHQRLVNEHKVSRRHSMDTSIHIKPASTGDKTECISEPNNLKVSRATENSPKCSKSGWRRFLCVK